MPAKALAEYLDSEPTWWASKLEDYSEEPASAFLREAVHLCDAVNQCRRLFKRKKDKTLNKDSQDSIFRLGAAALSALMGHFETFQRSLFAGSMELSTLLAGLDIEKVCRKLVQDSNLAIDLDKLVTYRGRPAQVGQLVADSLGGWHNPDQVNKHFLALAKYQFFSQAHSEQVKQLWQLRHSVVHTGGWLTHSDAQKLPALLALAGRPILLNEKFTDVVVRRLHKIVKTSTEGFGTAFQSGLRSSISAKERKRVSALFNVSSPRAWF